MKRKIFKVVCSISLHRNKLKTYKSLSIETQHLTNLFSFNGINKLNSRKFKHSQNIFVLKISINIQMTNTYYKKKINKLSVNVMKTK